MRRRQLWTLGFALLGTAGCRSLRVEAALRRPAELTATAEAGAAPPSPTPVLHLGKLAYVQGGDVWAKSLPDGAPRRLTTDGRNLEPLWSASGTWLAFRKNLGVASLQQLWMIRDTGTDARSVGVVRTDVDGQFAWNPRPGSGSDQLALVGNGGIRLVGTDGANPRRLVPESRVLDGGVQSLVWSPNGQWIAFQKTETIAQSGPNGETFHPTVAEGIWRIRTDGSGLSEVYANPKVALVRLSLQGWSPDGLQVLFWQYPTSASLTADGVSLEIVPTSGGQPLTIERNMLKHPDFVAWAPNGRDLALVVGGGRETWANKSLGVTTPVLPPRLLTPPDQVALDPAWSPDRTQIAFVAAPDRRNDAGGDVARLTAGRAIWVTRPTGLDRQALTSPGNARDAHPQWSSDGRFILFARVKDRRAQLWLMRADGSQEKMVVDELTPSPLTWDDHGTIPWDRAYDWWTGLVGSSHSTSSTGKDPP